MAPPTGGVSIGYTLHFNRRRSADRETEDSVGGIALEHGTLSTSGGALVAETSRIRWTG